MSSINFFDSTVLGATFRKPRISDIWNMDSVTAITRNDELNDLLKAFKNCGGCPIGSAVSVGTLLPLPFPIAYDLGKNAVTADNTIKDTAVILDMRQLLVADSSIDEEHGRFNVKSSKYNLTYVLLLLSTLMQHTARNMSIEASINHVPLRAYTHWVSNAMATAKNVNNEAQTVAEIRVIAGIYFLGKLNDIYEMDDEATLFFSRNLQKHLRIPEEIVNRVVSKITDAKGSLDNLGVMLANYVDHPSFKSIGETTVVTTLSRHIIVDGNYELGALSVDSPLVFAVLLHYTFSREFNVRSNFKNTLERSAMNLSDLTTWSSSFYKTIVS